MQDARSRARNRLRLRPRAQGGAMGSLRVRAAGPSVLFAFCTRARSSRASRSAGRCLGSRGVRDGWRSVAQSELEI